MKFFYTFILLVFTSILPVCAKDTVQGADMTITGKISSCVDGLIKIKKNGIEYSFSRSKNANYFGDYIEYKESAFSGSTTTANCRMLYIDLYKVTF